jgi:predicted transcriptional regulator
VSIIDSNNKKKKELKEIITKLNKELHDLNKTGGKDSQSLVTALKSSLDEKKETEEKMKQEFVRLTCECKELQDKINAKE